MNIWLRRVFFVLLGAVAGFAYYYFIGCVGGACPITSNPYISTGYGILVGVVAGWPSKDRKVPGSM